MPETPLLILAFDTSAAHCAAALLSGDSILSEVCEPMEKGQAERLMDLCSEILRDSSKTIQQLAAIGVGIGPGNFTGIRIAVSAARGLALGLGIPAVGVSAFEALRHGTSGPCTCAVDARRGQIYIQRFDEGTSAPELMDRDAGTTIEGPLIGAGGRPPVYPVAVAIARIAAERFRTVVERPAPLYLRPADAAPARDTPPVMLS